MRLVDLIIFSGLSQSKKEIERLIEQRGLKVDGKIVEDKFIECPPSCLISYGRRKWIKVEGGVITGRSEEKKEEVKKVHEVIKKKERKATGVSYCTWGEWNKKGIGFANELSSQIRDDGSYGKDKLIKNHLFFLKQEIDSFFEKLATEHNTIVIKLEIPTTIRCFYMVFQS